MIDESIEILKYLMVDSSTQQHQKSSFYKALVEVIKNDQDKLEQFLIKFVHNDEYWLVKSEYNEGYENFFESEFQKAIDEIDLDRLKKISEFWIGKIGTDGKINISAELLLIEAIHFGVIKYTKQLNVKDYYRRRVNYEINEVYEILFPCNYGRVRESYERMIYCDCDNSNLEHKFKFGGKIFISEDFNINRVITLDPLPKSLNISSVNSLTIALDFDKAFWTPIKSSTPYFIQHDKKGEPVLEISNLNTDEIEYFNQSPIVECNVVIRKTPDKYIHHPDSKNEWRIGGMPNWVQEEEKVICPTCQREMDFILQLPSGDLTAIDGKGVFYGSDGGTTFGFWCDKDMIMGYIWQDT
jgi:hypothetical protein